MEDVETLRRRARLPEIVGAEAHTHLPIMYRQRALNVDTRGVDVEATRIRGVPIAAGRQLRVADVDHRRRVVVLGDALRRRLLGADGGIGSWVRLDGKPFQVIGVLEHVGEQLAREGDLIDDQVWIPISTMQANWPQPWTDDYYVRTVLVRMRDRSLLEQTRSEVRAILAEGLGVPGDDEEAVVTWSPVMMLRQLPLDQMRGVLFMIAAATLVIGGIGTLTMMLDSVQERRREIGVRLAVGARRRDVVAQFFVETFTIVGLGGLLGVALGVGGCLALAGIERPELVPVPILRVGIVVLALSIMAAVGIVAGVVPAWRASGVDPSETLRME
jgi:putative ABC transport system permease protein